MITALTFLFKARDLSEKTFKAHFHVVPRAHHKLHLSASSFSRGPMISVKIVMEFHSMFFSIAQGFLALNRVAQLCLPS